jgi:hypothetical protein
MGVNISNSSVVSDNHKKQTLKIYHQNICGLGSKTDELIASLYPDLPDILCISEHHSNLMQIQLTSLYEYSLGAEFCRQFFHKRGGLYVYIHILFPFSTINVERFCQDKELETCAVKLKLLSKKSLYYYYYIKITWWKFSVLFKWLRKNP